MILRSAVLAVTAFSVASIGFAADRKHLADKHAPAGIMGDHMHEQGEWMVEYKYMNMVMEDNLIGDQKVSDVGALIYGVGTSDPKTNTVATPTDMTMEMHMMHIMYGASDNVTLYTMLMLPSLTMDHMLNDSVNHFTTHNSGFGDTGLGALFRLYSDERVDWILNLGGTVPTGDIYRVSSVTGKPLPYPMRLGTGTFNFRPGLTYKRFHDWWSYGAQLQADIPVGENYRGYSVGEEVRFSSWTSVLLTDRIALSYRGEHLWRNQYHGADPATPDAAISTNVESFRGGYWYSMGFGAQATLGGNYYNVEVVPTIGQDVNGIQLETDYSIIASVSRSW